MRREILLAAFEPEKKTKGRVRDLIWFSGVDVPRFDFWTGQEWTLRLPMDRVRLERLNNGAPLMKGHDYSRPVENQIGVFEKAWIKDGIGYATVRFSDRDDVTPIWNDIEAGIIRNVSQEIVIDDFEDVTPRGQKTKVMAATGWEVECVAIVPVNADPNAQFMSASPLYQSLALPGASGAAKNELGNWLEAKKARLRL